MWELNLRLKICRTGFSCCISNFFLCNSAWRNPKQLSQNASATQTNFGKYSLEFSLGEGSCCETRHSWRTQAFYLHGPCDGPRLDFRQYGDPGI